MPPIRHSVRTNVVAANAASRRWKADIERGLDALHRRTTELQRRDGVTRSRLYDMERRVGAVRWRLSDTVANRRRLAEVERRVDATDRMMREIQGRKTEVGRDPDNTGKVCFLQCVARCFQPNS